MLSSTNDDSRIQLETCESFLETLLVAIAIKAKSCMGCCSRSHRVKNAPNRCSSRERLLVIMNRAHNSTASEDRSERSCFLLVTACLL